MMRYVVAAMVLTLAVVILLPAVLKAGRKLNIYISNSFTRKIDEPGNDKTQDEPKNE